MSTLFISACVRWVVGRAGGVLFPAGVAIAVLFNDRVKLADRVNMCMAGRYRYVWVYVYIYVCVCVCVYLCPRGREVDITTQ
jgi:hypothetical protein